MISNPILTRKLIQSCVFDKLRFTSLRIVKTNIHILVNQKGKKQEKKET